jgi:glycerophosphoryl diester phosphodiesterase
VRRFEDRDTPAIVAHRGASATHPENTLPAFEQAIALGAGFVELDVRRSADGVAVVMHDQTLDRTTDGSGPVQARTAAELGALSAGSDAVPATVPTLAEALRLASGRCGLVLEIKDLPGESASLRDGAPTIAVAAVALDRVRFDGPLALVSFDPEAIAAARELAPNASTGLIFTEPLDPHEALAHATANGHDLLLPRIGVLELAGSTFLERAHASGVRVVVWVVDDATGVRRFLDLGVDAVVSNDPAMALEVLAGRR